MTVAQAHSTVGLRATFDAPTDGTTTAEVRIARDGRITHRRQVAFTVVDGKAQLKSGIKTEKVGIYRVGVRVNGKLVGDVVEFDVIPRTLSRSSSKRSISLAQAVLSRRKYVVGAQGQFDGRTGRALVAVRKRLGLSRTSTWDSTLARRLARGEGAYPVRFPGHGRHVEADLSMQILALIGEGGKVERIYPTSSGAPATPTVLGSYSVYRKDYGTNAKGMVHSSYFIRGYAIHGYQSCRPTTRATAACACRCRMRSRSSGGCATAPRWTCTDERHRIGCRRAARGRAPDRAAGAAGGAAHRCARRRAARARTRPRRARADPRRRGAQQRADREVLRRCQAHDPAPAVVQPPRPARRRRGRAPRRDRDRRHDDGADPVACAGLAGLEDGAATRGDRPPARRSSCARRARPTACSAASRGRC